MSVPLNSWLQEEPGKELSSQIDKLLACPDVVQIAIMADAHPGLDLPNGAAVATKDLIYPGLVGGDIGCGFSALRFSSSSEVVESLDLPELLARLREMVPTVKQNSKALSLPECCHFDGLSDLGLSKLARREGLLQLGTLGRGNHFIELDVDQEGNLWAVVHSGSRSMGPAVAAHHLKLAESAGPGLPKFLDLGDQKGQAYFNDMAWCLEYARENRMRILNRVADLLALQESWEPMEDTYLDAPHNFARRETFHQGELVVHRKSVNSACMDEPGIIGGSMLKGSRLVRGLGNQQSLCSSSHGAGRKFPRAQAFKQIKTKDFLQIMEGITFESSQASRNKDEAPQAYRDVDKVMATQKDLVRTTSRLRPLMCDKR